MGKRLEAVVGILKCPVTLAAVIGIAVNQEVRVGIANGKVPQRCEYRRDRFCGRKIDHQRIISTIRVVQTLEQIRFQSQAIGVADCAVAPGRAGARAL